MGKLEHKAAVITGAGRGIGRSIALAFAAEGAELVLAARSRDQLEKVAREAAEMGGKALAVQCDVSSPAQVRDLALQVREHFNGLDILVNNAGISKRSRFLEYDDEVWFEVLRTNLYGAYLTTKALLPLIQQKGEGRIIMMASSAAKLPVPYNSAYSASKHGLLGLMKSLACEVAMSGYPGITINAVCPFFVNTDMFTGPEGYVAQMVKTTGLSEEEVIKGAAVRNLQNRILEPEEIASLTVYLATQEAGGITGQSINICGGRVFN